MNYQEAIKIVSSPYQSSFVMDRAQGYLLCHAKAEKLVKALELIIQKYPEDFDYLYNGEEVRGIARDVLDDWRQSNGVVKP